MIVGKWNVRSLSRAGSLMTVAKETSKYKTDLLEVQEGRCDKGSTIRQIYNFLWNKE
jgi:hypothetical protein